jgi:peptide chain release factor 2
LRTVFDLAKKRERIGKLEKEIQKPDFWQDKEKAIKVNQELAQLHGEIGEIERLKEELTQLKSEKEIKEFEKKLSKAEIKIFLSEKYDKGNAILSIFAGAGGQDAQDWATMLLRMYERYSTLKGFQTKILHQTFGEGGGPEGRIGTKSVILEVKGNYAFGFLKKESGVHRLVRISPFSAKALRHTSFALVEVLPEIPKSEVSEIKIKPEDLKIDYYRASGPGGQYVNRRETAVRITHLPTGITVSCQSERLQGLNREKAMKVLIAKLHQLKTEATKKELKEIKGKVISASWGNQIRSYVLHPYKLVKDLRTGVETPNVEEVLDGNLDKFIEAEIKLR